MDNEKNYLSDLCSNNVSENLNAHGLPQNTNYLMSTLQSLQMQNIGNGLIPSNDIHCDFSNQFLLEQIQLRAMQSVYNSIGQNLDAAVPHQSQQNYHGTISLPFKGFAKTIDESSIVSHTSASTTSETGNDKQITFALGNTSENDVAQNPMNFFRSSNEISSADVTTSQTTQNTVKKTSENDKNFPILSTESVFSQKEIKMKTVPLTSSANEVTIQQSLRDSEDKTNAKCSVFSKEKQEKVRISDQNIDAFKIDFDEAHDDVDNILGLLLTDHDSRNVSLFRKQETENKGLSPINFTPPDSPNEGLTLDMLFDIAKSKSPDKKTEEQLAKQPEIKKSSNEPHQLTLCDENFEITESFSKANKIPVYKQKALLMSIEAKKAAKKENPNYDAFEFEEDEEDFISSSSLECKKETDTITKSDKKWKNVYISGKGFFSNHEEKEQTINVAKKQTSKTFTQVNEVSEKPFFTYSDVLRERNDKRIKNAFLEIRQKNCTACSKNMRQARPHQPLLPKLLIRVEEIHENIEETTKRRKNKKRSVSEEEDSDWDDDFGKPRKIIKKIYSLHDISDGRPISIDFLIKKRCSYDDTKYSDFVLERLRMFGPAVGILPKGTYVVCKNDVLKEDCALWRVDNQNLLQKFPPARDFRTDKQIYRSSSTYSGWCEQISSQYFRVAVKILKQNRSETTIEPEIPLHELFPAMSTEMFKNPKTVHFEEKKEPIIVDRNLDDMRHIAINTLIDAFLLQSININHIENLLKKNDWTYMRSSNEIDQVNKVAEKQIRQRIVLEGEHNKWIEDYTSIKITRNSFNCLTKCQVCKIKKSRRTVTFFHKNKYDTNIFSFNFYCEDLENYDLLYAPVANIITCGRCASAIKYLHMMRHMKLHLLFQCEEKLEIIGTEEVDQSPEQIVEIAKSDKLWIAQLTQKYSDMWDSIRLDFREF